MIEVMIVEDEPGIAELHSEFIEQLAGFRVIGIAGDTIQGMQIYQRLKPDLVILDHYLPGGSGLELLRAWRSHPHHADVIYITAANSTDVVKTALTSGVFDYLIKPINYQRFKDSLMRYKAYHHSLAAKEKVKQSELDTILAHQGNNPTDTVSGTGIDPFTLDVVMNAFVCLTTEHNAESLAKMTGLSKTTARRYLDHCVRKGKLVASLAHGKVGRPVRTYSRPIPQQWCEAIPG